MQPNTYEPPSRQGVVFSSSIAAFGRDACCRAVVWAPHSVFASLSVQALDPAPNTYRGSRRVALATEAGRVISSS